MPLKPQTKTPPPVRTRTRPAPKSAPAAEQAQKLEPTIARAGMEPVLPPPSDLGAAEISTPATASYEIGYGKPPREHRFKRGKSGNPKGRPKQAKSLNAMLRKLMLERVQVKSAKGIKRVAHIEAVLMKGLDAAGKGQFRAIDRMLSLYAAAVPEPRQDDEAPGPVDPVDLSASDRVILARFRDQVAAELRSAPEPPAAVEPPGSESNNG